MKRAFVGFSTPIGYSYAIKARPSRNDAQSSPNPVLYGATGLLTLYDELWFACESLCPDTMRDLPYVKFLDVQRPGMRPQAQGIDRAISEVGERISAINTVGLADMFEGGFTPGMTAYLGGQYSTDNHTHGLRFLDYQTTASSGARALVADLWLLDRNRDLKLDLTLNPLTAKLALQLPDPELAAEGIARLGRLELADGVLTFGSLYDIGGPEGPYHPCIEEIREDELIHDFRRWLDRQTTRLDNQEMRTIQEDVDARIRELTRKSLRAYVGRAGFSQVAVKVAKGALLDAIPGGSVLDTINEAVGQNKRADEEGWSAFIALSRDTLEEAQA